MVMDLKINFFHFNIHIYMLLFVFVPQEYLGDTDSEKFWKVRKIKCIDSGDKCPINKTCEFTCDYSCVNAPKAPHPVGTSVYNSSSSICKAALHDLRISIGDSAARIIKIRSFQKSECFLESSVRFGFSSYNLENESCNAFEFISPRISEHMLDVISIHSNYLYGENEHHKQVCFVSSNALSQSVMFDYYGNWSFSEKFSRDNLTYNACVKYTKLWTETRAVGFQCIPSKTTLSIITSIAFRKDASFLPKVLTVIANRNENVTLIMNEAKGEISEYKTIWRKDNNTFFEPDQGTRTELSLNNVSEISTGIYSLEYSNSSKTHKFGYVQLIVRSCPKEKYGTNCSISCQSCLNGGICHDITGECLCPPGFNGSNCEKACPLGYLGKRCSIKCPVQENTTKQLCKGILICLPRPYGCSCASGFTGLHCNQVCADGYYGAGCLQQHKFVHHKLESCSKFSDSCECLRGWHGAYCNESSPVLVNAPRLVNLTKDSIAVSFTEWSKTTDLGSGIPIYYKVVYKEYGHEHWINRINISAVGIENQTSVIEMKDLKPDSQYVVGVVVVDETDNMQENDLKLLNVTTLCGVSSLPPSDVELSTFNQNVTIIWKIPPKKNWNCRKIDMIIKLKNDLNNTEFDYKADEPFYSFFSEPYINWIVQVCISPLDGGNVTESICSETQNITSDGPMFYSPSELEVTKEGTSLFFKWIQPLKFSERITHYIIDYNDTNTGISYYRAFQSKDAACEGEESYYDCYKLMDLTAGHEYKIKITAFMVNHIKGLEIQSLTVKLEKSSNSQAAILGIFLPLVLAILLIILIIYLKKRKRLASSLRVKFFPFKVENEFATSNEALDEMDIIETESMSEEISNRIYVKDLMDYVKQNVQNNKIRKEFLSVPNGQIYPCSVAKLGENKPKNRYGNILPYDHSRVILDTIKEDAFSNYIHASYIHLKVTISVELNDQSWCFRCKMTCGIQWDQLQEANVNSSGDIPIFTQFAAIKLQGYEKVKKYIATQGPLLCTVIDFWRMVWSEGSCKILMITNFVENGKVKCEKYWTDDSCGYGDIIVKLEDLKSYADFIIRTFKISKGKSSREIKQFHFISWPDHGAPSTTPFVTYLKKSRLYKPECEAPVIIHCSAGIGRTGTTILLDSMIDMGIREKHVDLINHLCSMRKQRMNILENMDQYLFVHYALVECFCFEDTEVKLSDFKAEFEKLQNIDNATGLTYIETQFQALSKVPTGLMYKDTQAAYLLENQSKNRSMLILPPDQARPRLPRDSSGTDYINAVYVDNFSTKSAIVATQYPLPETVRDFWSMVYETKSETVILLQDIDPSHQDTPQLWPTEGLQTFEALQIETQSVTEEECYTIVTTSVSYSFKETYNPLTVNIIILKNWPFNSNLPAEPTIVLPTILKVLCLQSQCKHVVTAVCSDGVTACGIFCTVFYICDQIKTEQVVDVVHAIKCVKANRPQFILDLDQFKFLYELINLYVDSQL